MEGIRYFGGILVVTAAIVLTEYYVLTSIYDWWISKR